MVNVFFVPIFFIVFRETLETSIIVSVLLAFLKQSLDPERDPTTYKKLVRQVWMGTGIGLFICVAIGAGMIGAFYGIGADHWAKTEDIWEGSFAIIATVIITLMGAALLRISKLQDKWRLKLARALEAKDLGHGSIGARLARFTEKHAMFILPFVTVLREGLEAVVFIGGVSLGQPATAFPLPVICGLTAGTLVGLAIYKGANLAKIQIFLIISTCFLYLVAAGLLSKAVKAFEAKEWDKTVGGEADEAGAGPGSYDIRKSVWHVNCCSPELGGGGGWGVFNSLFGWTNSATYGSVISYNVYWIVVSLGFIAMRYKEKTGYWPFRNLKATSPGDETNGRTSSDQENGNSAIALKETDGKGVVGPSLTTAAVPSNGQ